MLVGEADVETLIIKLHDICQCGGGAVVEIRRARRQAAQDRSLQLADIGAFASDQGAAGVGNLKYLPG